MVLCHAARVGDPANRLRLVVPAGGFIERTATSRASEQVWERADPGLIGLGTDSLAVHRPIRTKCHSQDRDPKRRHLSHRYGNRQSGKLCNCNTGKPRILVGAEALNYIPK